MLSWLNFYFIFYFGINPKKPVLLSDTESDKANKIKH